VKVDGHIWLKDNKIDEYDVSIVCLVGPAVLVMGVPPAMLIPSMLHFPQFVFIDSLHSVEFSSWYTRDVLDKKTTPAQVGVGGAVNRRGGVLAGMRRSLREST
jgi:hypothetical protein